MGRAVFGDRRGLTLFLGTVCFVGLTWRAGVFVTDTRTLVATLDALAAGRLWIEPATGSHFAAPGAVVADGFVYGRNYGQVLLSLPILWALAALETVAELRVGLTALWHLALLALVVQVGHLFGRRRLAAVGGGVLVVGSFAANLVLATQFVEVPRPLLALQGATILATGFLAVATYRLVARRHGETVGSVVGGATAVVLPVGFWASLPKRHVFVALLLVGLCYSFARSREAASTVDVPIVGSIPGFRALCYVLVGLLAWIHAGEAVFALLALVVVDLPTAPSNDRRTLATLGVTFALAMVPFVVTNVLVSGDPTAAPRMLPPADGSTAAADGLASRFAGGGSSGIPLLDDLLRLPRIVLAQVLASLDALSQSDRVVQTWIRSGSTEFVGSGRPEFAGSNLAVLESVPLFGAFAALAAVVASGVDGIRAAVARVDPTDLLAVGLTVAFVLFYAHRLPIHVQITVRYLVPTVPLLAYLLVRLAPVRRCLSAGSIVGWTYVAATLIGTQLLLAVVVLRELPVSAAIQLHALVGLAAATLLAASILLARLDDRAAPVAAASLGIAAAAGTAFVLLTGLAYFSFVGEHVLPVADAVADLVGRI